MKTVAELLQSKGNASVYTISPEQTVLEAVALMADKGIGALLVTEGSDVVGIITERDYARKVILLERSSQATPVSDIMTAAVMYVHPSQTSSECMKLMTEKRLRHLPVLENGKLLGLLSIGDLVKGVISDQQETIDQLEQYIRGE
mgnify:FL=1